MLQEVVVKLDYCLRGTIQKMRLMPAYVSRDFRSR